MALYYVNMQQQKGSGNNHEVHTTTCPHFFSISKLHRLGEFNHCSDAVTKAKELEYSNVDGCRACCKECNKD